MVEGDMPVREYGCRSCGAAIVWIKTSGGKSMPCNAEPIYYIEKPRAGTKRVVLPNGEVISCEYTDNPSKATGVGYVPHWSTCPHAAEHKRDAKK